MAIGTKMILIVSLSHPAPQVVLNRIYEAYADRLKSPFYTAEMPIRSETFDKQCEAIVSARTF